MEKIKFIHPACIEIALGYCVEYECENCPMQRCFDMLVEYKNIGLTPKEIKKLIERENKER